MNHYKNYLKVSLFFLYVAAIICSECPKKVKYSILSVALNETQYLENEVISPEKRAFSVKLEENVPVLCKKMLNITQAINEFHGIAKGIQEIEAGTFENQKIQFVLRLSDNLLTVIRKGTFKNLPITDLNLDNNQIKTVEEGAIQDMPNLFILHLSKNKIKHFHPNSVSNTPKLLFLDMLVNKMEKLEEKHFPFMTKENGVGIGVGSNELRKIHPNAFEGINIFALNISNNKLESIPKEVFSRNKLQYLSIADNKLTHLDDEFFKLNTTLIDVELHGNDYDEETLAKLKPFMEIIKENKRRGQSAGF